MSEILTKPKEQMIGLQGQTPNKKNIPAGAWTKIVNNNPARLFFWVMPLTATAGLVLVPWHPTDPMVSVPTGGTVTPFLVHASLFPSLTQVDWWAWSDVGTDIFIQEVSDRDASKPNVP